LPQRHNVATGKRFSVKKNENYGTGIPQEWEEVAYFVLGWIDDKDMEKKRQMDIDELGKTKRVSIYRFATERELLRGLLVFRTDRDINIEVGHNNENFDLPYEIKRMLVLGIYDHAPFKCVYGKQRRAAAPRQRCAVVSHFFSNVSLLFM
jgi:DNA polymerase elongation subunit (family B)